MQGLLGKITQVEEIGPEYRVTFKPEAVLPSRSTPPEWLKDQSLTVTRRAVDPREIGRAGDGIVLSAPDAVRWLTPLTVSPDTARGAVPKSITVRLAWWKDEAAPECTVKVGGRTIKSTLAADGDGGFSAEIDLAGNAIRRAPATIEVECGSAKAFCRVLPEEPAAVKSIARGRPHLTVDNAWYRVDIATATNAGGIAGLTEVGRGLDHFAPPENLIQPPLEYAGHYEHYRTGGQWYDGIAGVAASVIGTRREGDAACVSLEACVEEGQGIHSSVRYTAFDRMPLVLIQREFRRHPPKEDKGGEDKEPVEAVEPFCYSSRSASVAEHGATDGSRVFTSHGGRLFCVRPVQCHEVNTLDDLRLADGWVLAEHPGRRSYMLYLTDRTDPPGFIVWHGFYEIAVEPIRPHTLLGPGQSVGLSIGVAAGETAGVDARGAWVACRSALRDGVQQCAVIARFVDNTRESEPTPARSSLPLPKREGKEKTAESEPTASIRLGDRRQEVKLETAYLSGIGSVSFAVATFEGVRANDSFSVEVDGIVGR